MYVRKKKGGEIKSHFANTSYASSWVEPTNPILGEREVGSIYQTKGCSAETKAFV
jgi:hypothetical protein